MVPCICTPGIILFFVAEKEENMEEKIKKIREELDNDIKNVTNLNELGELKVKYLKFDVCHRFHLWNVV